MKVQSEGDVEEAERKMLKRGLFYREEGRYTHPKTRGITLSNTCL